MSATGSRPASESVGPSANEGEPNRYETITFERSSGGVVRVTLNRPKQLNAINREMLSDLSHVFGLLRYDQSARVVVLAAAGRGFCSGGDLSVDPESRPNPLASMRRVADVAMILHDLPQPTIAAVNGVAVGAGCNLALSCDLIVASEEARFGEVFARNGLSPDFGGTWILPRLIGLHKAKEMAFFGDIILADEALRIGIVNRVVPAADLNDFVDNWAQLLSLQAPIALAQTKSLLNKSIGSSLREVLEAESVAQCVNYGTSDFKEGMEAWKQKRPPEFRGV